jgi:hypothetical protein
MLAPFEKWWENTGYFQAKEKGILNDAVEISRLAFQAGLYTSPIPRKPIGKDSEFDFKSHFVKCNCGCQILEVERYDYKDGDEGFNFVVWDRGRQGKRLRFKERIRWCWNILKTGSPWADDIIATNKDARGLAEFLIQNLPKEDSNEESKV